MSSNLRDGVRCRCGCAYKNSPKPKHTGYKLTCGGCGNTIIGSSPDEIIHRWNSRNTQTVVFTFNIMRTYLSGEQCKSAFQVPAKNREEALVALGRIFHSVDYELTVLDGITTAAARSFTTATLR